MRSNQGNFKRIAPNLSLAPIFRLEQGKSLQGIHTERTSQGVNCSRTPLGGSFATILARKQQGTTIGSKRDSHHGHTDVDTLTLAVAIALDAAGTWYDADADALLLLLVVWVFVSVMLIVMIETLLATRVIMSIFLFV